MEVEREKAVVIRLRAHVDAARRHRQAAQTYPQASDGFLRAARLHIARAATLATEICSGAGRQDQAPEAVSASG